MSNIKFTIDGKECSAKSGQTIVEAAKDNGVYIPTLCHFDGLKPAGTCRICTVKVGGRNMAACTTPVTNGMVVENKTPELEDFRKAIIGMLFVEGNHMCPTCEKSGSCELQALGYRYQMMVPRFPFLFPKRAVDASSPKLYIDKNRCVQCLRCVRGITSADGRKVFGLVMRGGHAQISMDNELAAQLSDAEALKAMELCPVGAILRKEVGYAVPIGKRKYDKAPIGSEIEK
ncbi:MAG TPA: 2Fe-2S iron-sulfur cluster-binding protein [Spirochaetota bacterium]|nr:2Fe-2S iron-sulfur cluster-binding protein [Spirochaetota bacterium]